MFNQVNLRDTDGQLSGSEDNNNGEADGMLSNPADTGTSSGSSSQCSNRDDTFTWNEENRMVESTVSGESTLYVYNAGGERTIKLNKEDETLYVDKLFQVLNRDQITKHIFVGDIRIVSKLSYLKATVATTSDTGYERKNQFYYHTDHLGSTSFVTCWDDKNNTVMEYEHYEYTPYGETWVEEKSDTLNKINHKFSSKELDAETGLYNFGFRYYDPTTSRWMSADPIYDGVRDGLGIYGYCRNNPLKYHDPNGLVTAKIVVSKEKLKVNEQVQTLIDNGCNAIYLNESTAVGGDKKKDKKGFGHSGWIVKNKNGDWVYISKDDLNWNEKKNPQSFAKEVTEVLDPRKENKNYQATDLEDFMTNGLGSKYDRAVGFKLDNDARTTMIDRGRKDYNSGYWLSGLLPITGSNNCADLAYNIGKDFTPIKRSKITTPCLGGVLFPASATVPNKQYDDLIKGCEIIFPGVYDYDFKG